MSIFMHKYFIIFQHLRGKDMAKNFRLNDKEEEILYRSNLTVNRELIRLGKAPITDSKLLHIILEQTLEMGELEVTRDGNIRVLSQNEIGEK